MKNEVEKLCSSSGVKYKFLLLWGLKSSLYSQELHAVVFGHFIAAKV